MFIALKIWKLHNTPRATLWGHEERERQGDMQREKEREWTSVQSLSRVWLFETPWTAARQASLSITNSWSLLKLMSTESVMPSNHFILCRPPFLPPSIFPSNRIFSSESILPISGQSIGVSASASCANQENGPRILFLLGSRVEFEVLTLYWWI